MSKIGRLDDYVYCINNDCKESKQKAEHLRTYSSTITRRYVWVAIFAMISGAMFNSSGREFFTDPWTLINSTIFFGGVITMLTAAYLMYSASDDAVNNDLAEREMSYEDEKPVDIVSRFENARLRARNVPEGTWPNVPAYNSDYKVPEKSTWYSEHRTVLKPRKRRGISEAFPLATRKE